MAPWVEIGAGVLVMAAAGLLGWSFCVARYYYPRWKEGHDAGYKLGREHAEQSLGGALGQAHADIQRAKLDALRARQALQEALGSAMAQNPSSRQAKALAEAYEQVTRERQQQLFGVQLDPTGVSKH